MVDGCRRGNRALLAWLMPKSSVTRRGSVVVMSWASRVQRSRCGLTPVGPEYVVGVGARDRLAGHLGPTVHEYVRVGGVEALTVSESGVQSVPGGRVERHRSEAGQ